MSDLSPRARWRRLGFDRPSTNSKAARALLPWCGAEQRAFERGKEALAYALPGRRLQRDLPRGALSSASPTDPIERARTFFQRGPNGEVDRHPCRWQDCPLDELRFPVGMAGDVPWPPPTDRHVPGIDSQLHLEVVAH